MRSTRRKGGSWSTGRWIIEGGPIRRAVMAMRIEVVTLFPEMVQGAARYGVTGRALERGTWTLACRNPRDYATDAYRSGDDRPDGGGPGRVMLAEPLSKAIDAARESLSAAG